MSQFVREFLVRQGGTCTRDQILEAMRQEPAMAARLERGQGLNSLLNNLRNSGFVILNGQTVTASDRTIRRTLL